MEAVQGLNPTGGASVDQEVRPHGWDDDYADLKTPMCACGAWSRQASPRLDGWTEACKAGGQACVVRVGPGSSWSLALSCCPVKL